MKKAGKAMTSDEIFSDEGQAIRGRAKAQTRLKQDIYMKGRLGLVIDGTGKDVNKIIKQAKELQDLGYDTKMILVNTDLETAVKETHREQGHLVGRRSPNTGTPFRRILVRYKLFSVRETL